MQMRSILVAIILVTAWSGTINGQATRSGPVCTADQSGKILVTTIEYGDGYRVDAPWRISSERKVGRAGTRLTAMLNHIIETDPVTRKRQITPLPSVVELTFKGEDRRQILREAADVWCATVGKAMAERLSHGTSRVAQNRVVM